MNGIEWTKRNGNSETDMALTTRVDEISTRWARVSESRGSAVDIIVYPR